MGGRSPPTLPTVMRMIVECDGTAWRNLRRGGVGGRSPPTLQYRYFEIKKNLMRTTKKRADHPDKKEVDL